jgi:hypothetical protein
LIQAGIDITVMKKPTTTIEVNSGYSVEAGFEYSDIEIENFSTQFLLGYKRDNLTRILKKKKNVPIVLTRQYISVIEKYADGKAHYGLGLSYHVKPRVDYTYNSHTRRVFDNALGYIALGGYSITENIDIDLKAIYIKYKIEVKRKKKIYKREYNTSFLGVFLSYKF